MIFGFKPLEVLYLLIGMAILGNEIFITQSLTTTELGAALFFFGLTAASVADREGSKGPVDFLRLVVEIFRGGPPPSQGQGKEKDS
jgi:hypothetical protein